jgi:soluble lytic murein transglycosylase
VTLALLFVLAASLAACRGGGAPEARPPAKSSARAAEPAPAGSGKGGLPGDAAIAVDEGLPKIRVVLDDPRLLSARERDQARDDGAAAREVDRVQAASSIDRATSCEWSYVAGRLHLAAGEPSDAVVAFERAAGADDAGAPCPLSSYAFLREAQALGRAGRYEEALAAAHAVGGDLATGEEAQAVLADALASKGDRPSAVPIWRSLLTLPGARPGTSRWAEMAVRLAAALLDGADGAATAHAEEALDLLTRVLVESPMAVERLDVLGLRARAAALPSGRGPPPLTTEERVRQAQAWLDASQPKRAREVAEDVLKTAPRGGKLHREAVCKAAILAAQAMPRGQAEALAAAWGVAIARCDGDDALATALYSGAKASSSAQRYDEAIARFRLVEAMFPRHRLADDARLRSALVVREQGDDARSLAILESIPDAYPEGDMRGEALFRVALARLVAGDPSAARASLDRCLALSQEDRGAGLAGRAAYFRARVAELTGDASDAKSRYTALVVEQPLTYYMLLAYARLSVFDVDLARGARDAAMAREQAGPFLTRDHPEFASQAFDRFVRLLEVGEIDAARREAAAGGLVAESVDPEVLWTIAWLYDRAGAPDLGHAFARGRLLDFRSHWPSGRWRLAWEAAFPRAWESIVASESESSRVPAPLTWAIMREESAFNPDAHSLANAIGLMQLLGGTARQVARGTPLPWDDDSLRRPPVAIALGTRLLASLRVSFPGRPGLAIAAYNGGSGSVRRWLADRGTEDFDVFVERIPFDETRAYVKRVLASEAAYAYLYAPEVLDEVFALPRGPTGRDPAAPP